MIGLGWIRDKEEGSSPWADIYYFFIVFLDKKNLVVIICVIKFVYQPLHMS